MNLRLSVGDEWQAGRICCVSMTETKAIVGVDGDEAGDEASNANWQTSCQAMISISI